MGNRAIITIETPQGVRHPVAIYLHWNGGLESVLAFMRYTWNTFDRTHGDIYTFHIRLCQVIGNFMADGLSVYGQSASGASDSSSGGDHGHWRFCLTDNGPDLVDRRDRIPLAETHAYWTARPSIFDVIAKAMPAGTPHRPVRSEDRS